jgi:DNA adenine methylase
MTSHQANGGHPSALPFLRWAGSKKQHLPLLKSFWSDSFSRYVEPFAGSAVLFFSISPNRALLGDINKELIATFKAIRDHPSRVHRTLVSIPKGRSHYKKVRKVKPASLRSIKRAARFIYLNRYCFNGLYRTNSKGEFNVPYGGKRSGTIPTLDHLKNSAACLKRATLMCADFRKTIQKVRKGDFVYLDPPYAVSNRRVFVEYAAKPFSVSDLAVLKRLLTRIDKKGATFVLSYAYCDEARKAFSSWQARRILTRRSVAGFHGARRNQYELCVTNYRVKESLNKSKN